MTPADTRTVDELVRLLRAGATAWYFHFWGHKPENPDRIDKSCLSNWYPAGFDVDGIRYATTEHFMMARKAELFHDDEALTEILAAGSPKAAKMLGRRVRHFDERVWRQNRVEIVVGGNCAKFEQNDGLKTYLLGTGDAVLVEASPRDRIWGIGMGASNPDAENPERWRGGNLLGFALMEVRARLIC